jgi:hypothetical protein
MFTLPSNTLKKLSLLIALNVNVPTAGAVVVMLLQLPTNPLPWQVTTYVLADDAELKITSSAEVGAEAPPAPPDVADQFVVVRLFQVPLPPTQYLVAI